MMPEQEPPLTMGAIRESHVVEFDEGRRIAWMPAEPVQASLDLLAGLAEGS